MPVARALTLQSNPRPAGGSAWPREFWPRSNLNALRRIEFSLYLRLSVRQTMKCASATEAKNPRSSKSTFQRSFRCLVGGFASASFWLVSKLTPSIEVVAQLEKKEMIAFGGILIAN